MQKSFFVQKKNQSNASANAIGGPTASSKKFVDNRPQAFIQRQIQNQVNKSAESSQRQIYGDSSVDKYQQAIPSVQKNTNDLTVSDTPIQRRVANFNAVSTIPLPSPADELITAIDMNYFNESPHNVNAAFARKFNARGWYNPMVNQVTADVDRTAANSPGRGGLQGQMGLIGRDEMLIKRGTDEFTEGGHLIPVSLWDTTDAQANLVNTSDNVVPMTATMNHISWLNEFETKIRRRVRGNNYQIDVQRGTHDVKYDHMASFLGLSIDGAHNGNDSVNINEWIPRSIDVQKTQNGGAVNNWQVDESSLAQTPGNEITTGQDVLNLLEAQGLKHYLAPALQAQIQPLV